MLDVDLKPRARMQTIKGYQCFLLHLYRFSPSTQSTYGGVIQRFVDSAPRYIDQISAEHIERFLFSCRKTRIASTCNLYLVAIKSWFTWMEENYNVPNITKRVRRLKTLLPHQRILTKEEYSKIIEITDGYMRDCIQILAMTGLRASEFLSLQPENIDCQFLTIIGKGQKQRSIPLNTIVLNILKANPHLNFIKSRNRKWLYRLCCRAAKIADIPHFSPHSLRHYFATQLHRNKVPIEIIGKLLGHSSPLVTTMIYLHWQDSDLAGVTDVLK